MNRSLSCYLGCVAFVVLVACGSDASPTAGAVVGPAGAAAAAGVSGATASVTADASGAASGGTPAPPPGGTAEQPARAGASRARGPRGGRLRDPPRRRADARGGDHGLGDAGLRRPGPIGGVESAEGRCDRLRRRGASRAHHCKLKDHRKKAMERIARETDRSKLTPKRPPGAGDGGKERFLIYREEQPR